MPIRLHEEDPKLFVEAIRFTAAERGFIPRLIEKDYFCSVLLENIASHRSNLIFKGGTLLAKVHSGFYRLSEDLDFSISTAPDSTKKSRSQSATPIKAAIADVPNQLAGFQVEEALTGFNGSTQYNALVSYPSSLASQRETIKIEIGVRELTMTDVHAGQAATLLMNPVRGNEFIGPVPIASLTYSEAMAEKMRAALCRREVAIRDFFDIDHAIRNGRLSTLDSGFLDLLRRKLAVEGTAPIDVSRGRLDQLRAQLDAQLRPVLRTKDFGQFDLARAFQTVSGVAQTVG